jgi:hypothetical protein
VLLVVRILSVVRILKQLLIVTTLLILKAIYSQRVLLLVDIRPSYSSGNSRRRVDISQSLYLLTRFDRLSKGILLLIVSRDILSASITASKNLLQTTARDRL